MGKTNCSRDTINGTCHTKYLKLCEVPISFSTEDQWTNFFEPGKLSLLLDHVVAGVRLTKALIDGGSGLNILFASTLCQMGLEFSKIRPTKSPSLLVLLKYPFYPLFNFDNGMNLISKSLTILTSARLLVVFAFAHIF